MQRRRLTVAGVWHGLTRPRILALVVVLAVALGLFVASTTSSGHRSSSPTSTPSPSTPPPPPPSPPTFVTWPNANTTGVPTDVRPLLKRMSKLDVTKDGAFITRVDVEGCLDVQANNVTITQSIIRCAGNRPVVHMLNGESGLVLDQVELDGASKASACIAFANFKIYRSNLHDCADGVDFTSNVVVSGCFIHDLARGPGTHNDALQTPGGYDDLIADNTLQAYRADTDDPMNAALQTGRLDQPLRNVTVRHNYMDGGNYTVNAGGSSTDGHSITDYTITQNVFGRHFRYGPVQSIGKGTVFDDTNVWADNGKPVKASG